jgi:hypothetical protein
MADPFDEYIVLTKRTDGTFDMKARSADGSGREYRCCSCSFTSVRGFFQALDLAGYHMAWCGDDRPTDDQVRLVLPGVAALDADLASRVREALDAGQRPVDAAVWMSLQTAPA